MSHARKQLRDAVKEILDTGSSWKYVYPTRIAPNRQVFPYLMVFVDGEPNIQTNMDVANVYEREMSLAIVAMLRAPTDKITVEDQIDTISAEVETKLTNAALRTKLSTFNLRVAHTQNQMTVIVDEDDKVDRAEIVMSFTITYLTKEGSPEILL